MDPSTRTARPIRPDHLRDAFVQILEQELSDRKRLCRRWEGLFWSMLILNVGALVVILMLVSGRG